MTLGTLLGKIARVVTARDGQCRQYGLAIWFVLVGCHSQRIATTPPPPPAVPPTVAGPTISFRDRTTDSGLQFVYRNGREAGHHSILESLGGGVGLVDYDQDQALDVFLPGGGGFAGTTILGLPSALFRSCGDGRYVNVSQAAGAGFTSTNFTHGCSAADANDDGFPDLVVTGYGGLQFWRNLGDGTFVEDHVAAELSDQLWSSAAGWGDVDGDGLADLYVAHYTDWSFDNHPHCTGPRPDLREICSPRVFGPLPDVLYRNTGDGRFADMSVAAGLRPDGKGLGVVLGDVDLDGDTDLYVANDTTENFLYLNRGSGSFQEVAALNGAAVDERGTPNGSMGVDLGDFNLDGLPDIWVANYEVESFALYRNDGRALFVHVSQATGITALNGLFVGFGTAFADLDRDGDEDLAVANGHVINFPRNAPVRQLPLILRNNQGRRFERLTLDEPYFNEPHVGRGLATGDLDDDGDVDLVISHSQEPAVVLWNTTKAAGAWLRVRLIGRRSNRDGIGATLWLKTSHGDYLRLLKGGSSYLSQGDWRPHWGIPADAAVQQLEIRWPSGIRQTVPDIALNQTLVVIEPPAGPDQEPRPERVQ